MRRRPSTQNLLAVPSSSAPPVLTLPGIDGPLQDSDAQSMFSDTLSIDADHDPAHETSAESLRRLIHKRIATLTYLRDAYEGRAQWFHTLAMSRAELDREFNNPAMRLRTRNYTTLGLSVASLLDIHHAPDFVHRLQSMLSEYDHWKDDGDRPKTRLFRGKSTKRSISGLDFPAVTTESSETAHLLIPHIPFAPDYHQTLIALLDVLSEVYHRLARMLGPSPLAPSRAALGPLGALLPQPGVSYLFPPGAPRDPGSLWAIAHAAPPGAAVLAAPGTAPAAADVLKIDGKIKKVTAVLSREISDCVRGAIRDELASLDPMLAHRGDADEDDEYDVGERTPRAVV